MNDEQKDVPRCPKCGYTYEDCRFHMDHHLCGEPTPAKSYQTCASTGSSTERVSGDAVAPSQVAKVVPATPLPWESVRTNAGEFVKSQVVPGYFVTVRPILRAGQAPRVDAEYIAKSANAYPKFVAMLQRYLATADRPLGMSELADLDTEARDLLQSLGELE